MRTGWKVLRQCPMCVSFLHGCAAVDVYILQEILLLTYGDQRLVRDVNLTLIN